MNQPKSLQSGTRIDDYEIKETLWTTNSGFTYRARDLDRDRDVLIQEFLPAALATRHWSGIHAMPLEGLADDFDQGLTRFLREARILAQINDPYVCRVYEYTEANATAYMVLDYEPGQTLKDHLAARQGPLDDGEIRKLLVPLLKGLRIAHAADLLHRDIHPANIYLRDVGPPVLIGFGSPVATAHDDDQHIEHRVAPGYSPVEQYQSHGVIGPWSDLYALGATMYRCLSGAAPVDAARRITEIAQDKEDPLVPATELGVSDYSSGLLGAIDWMMEPMAGDRPDSAGAVLGPLTEERSPQQPPPPADRHAAAGGPQPGNQPAPRASGDAPKTRTETYRDHSKRGTPVQRAPRPVEDQPGTSTPVTPVYRTSRPGSRRATGWGWPALVILAGVSLIVLFLFYRPSPSQNAAVSDAPPGMDIQEPDPVAGDAYPLPDLPRKVNFGREQDDQRADAFRDLDQRTGQIEQMLAAAEENMNEGRLISPAGDNALAGYRAVLALDPDQTDARLGIAAIQTELVKSAETAFADEDIETAEQLLDQAGEIREESDRARALREEIQQHRAEQERQQQLAREAEQRREEARQRAEQEQQEQLQALVDQAEAAFEAGRLTQPPGENALALYRRALRLDPEHPDALQGVARVGRRYIDQASDAIANDELARAEGLLSTAAAILPDNESILLLRNQLDTRQAAMAEQRREQQRLAALAEREAPAPEPMEEIPPRAASPDLDDGVEAYYAGDYDIAYRLLNPLADDHPRAKFRIAMMYHHGRGVEQDINVARTLIREALPKIREQADEGAAWAQADLASLYADGIVVAENDAEAVRLYRLAADQGYAGAQTNLGVMYANGEGVLRSRDDAIVWLQRAADQGDRIAQKNLRALGVQ